MPGTHEIRRSLALAALLALPSLAPAGAWGQVVATDADRVFPASATAPAAAANPRRADLAERYFQLEMHMQDGDEAAARAEILDALAELMGLLVDALGEDTVVERLETLAENEPLGDARKVMLHYFDRRASLHPHNIAVGVPYTGVILARAPESSHTDPQIRPVVIHEVSHTFFGKFNAGLAEPIADLFRDKSAKADEMDAVALAILNRVREGGLPAFRFEEIFGYRPSALVGTCAALAGMKAAGLAGARFEEVMRTDQEITTCRAFQGFYSRDLNERPPFECPTPPGAPEEPAREESPAAEAPARPPGETRAAGPGGGRPSPRNPNETRGVARSVLGALGDAVQRYFLAVHGLATYLDFYYYPNERTLQGLGIAGFEGLEDEVRAYLGAGGASGSRQEFDEYLRNQVASEEGRADAGEGPSCLTREGWNEDGCLRAPPGEDEGEGDAPAAPVFGRPRSATPLPVTDLSISAALGSGFDLASMESYCHQDHGSKPIPRPEMRGPPGE